MVKTRIEIFPDIKEHVDFFDKVPDYDVSMYVHKKMKTDEQSSLKLLCEVLPLLESCDDYSNDNLYKILQEFAAQKEYKTGFVMWPLRTALSGKQMTPGGATELMEVLVRVQVKGEKDYEKTYLCYACIRDGHFIRMRNKSKCEC